MSYILLYHNANVKPVMIGKKISIILHDVMLLKVRRTGCAMNPAGKKIRPGGVGTPICWLYRVCAAGKGMVLKPFSQG